MSEDVIKADLGQLLLKLEALQEQSLRQVLVSGLTFCPACRNRNVAQPCPQWSARPEHFDLPLCDDVVVPIVSRRE